jgi:hypothetical protein
MPSFSRCHDLLLLRGAFDLPSRSSALRSIAAGHRGGRCRCRRLRWPRGVFWPPDRCRRRSRRRGLRCSCPRGFPTFRFIRGGRFIGSRRGSSIRWPGRRLHRGIILRAMGPSGRWARRRRPTHSCIARASEARPHRTNRATAANARNKRNDNGGAPVSSRMRSPQMSPVSLPVLDFRHAKHDRSTLGGTAWPAVVARHRGVTMVPIILAAIGAACSGSGASMSTVCAITDERLRRRFDLLPCRASRAKLRGHERRYGFPGLGSRERHENLHELVPCGSVLSCVRWTTRNGRPSPFTRPLAEL